MDGILFYIDRSGKFLSTITAKAFDTSILSIDLINKFVAILLTTKSSEYTIESTLNFKKSLSETFISAQNGNPLLHKLAAEPDFQIDAQTVGSCVAASLYGAFYVYILFQIAKQRPSLLPQEMIAQAKDSLMKIESFVRESCYKEYQKSGYKIDELEKLIEEKKKSM